MEKKTTYEEIEKAVKQTETAKKPGKKEIPPRWLQRKQSIMDKIDKFFGEKVSADELTAGKTAISETMDKLINSAITKPKKKFSVKRLAKGKTQDELQAIIDALKAEMEKAGK